MNKFIIVGTQRTGSSAIAESLGLHPMIACGREWTLRVPRRKKFLIAEKALNGNFNMLRKAHQEHINGAFNNDKSWLGFRWLFSSSNKWIIHPRYSPALWIDRLEDFIKWVPSRPKISIIHIVRKDSVDWLKSVYLARKLRAYSKIKYPDGVKVKIPELEATHRLISKNWIDSRLSGLALTNPFLRVVYEDFLENKDKTICEGLKFLKCDHNLQTNNKRSLKKQSKGKVEDYITNYNDLIDHLREKNLLNAILD